MSQDGQYGDLDLIACAVIDAPDVHTASFAAQYIRYGKLVYQFDAPEKLGEAIVAIDSNSTHDAAQLWREELARKMAREQGTLTPENPTNAPDALDPTQPAPSIPAADADKQEPIINVDPNYVGETDPLLGNSPDALTESVPDFNEPAPDAEVLGEASSTLEATALPTEPAVDLSTTTPE
jgi:hypothetical protein